jgi:ribonucleoside-diphosphate reductase alpha chain
MQKVIVAGSCQNILEIPIEIRDVFKTATEISWKHHIAMQSAFQEHTDNAVSKTINLPEATTPAEIGEIIRKAYRLSCKGLTIYRNNSRKYEAVSVGTKREKAQEQVLNLRPRKRPDRLSGFTERVETGCGKLYVTVNFDEQGHPFEVFAETDGGGCEAFSEGVSRMASLALRAGVDVKEIVEQLRAVKCANFIRKAATGHIKGKSCPDVIGRILESSIQAIVEHQQVHEVIESGEGDKCPNCGKALNFAEGCWSCSCGFSRCS